MSLGEQFKNIDKRFQNFMSNYSGELDIEKVLDTSYLKDDLDGLIKEITKQPSVYAYWANMRRMVEERYAEIETKFNITKSRYLKVVTQELKSQGIAHPTNKAVETKFKELYAEADWYIKYQKVLQLWRERRDTLAIIEKAVYSRGESFRSLSYLLGNMMNQGIYHQQRRSKRTHG